MCQSKRQLKFFNAIGEIFVSRFTTSNKGLNNQLYLNDTKSVAIELFLYYILHSDNRILYLIQLLLRLKHWTFCNNISA